MNMDLLLTKRKVPNRKGIKYFSKINVAEFLLESGSPEKGDEILITGPTTGAVEAFANEIRVDLKTVDKAVKGQHISIALEEKIRPSDKLYKIVKAD